MRKQYSAAFKAQVVLEALKETKTVAQIASEHQLHPNLVTKWKQEAVAELPVVFERRNTQAQAQEAQAQEAQAQEAQAQEAQAQEAQEQKVAQLYEQIGRLTTQLAWIKKKSGLEPDV
jgi:transposase-like protein